MSGADHVINELFKYCHNYCIELIVLNTSFILLEWCLDSIYPLYKNNGFVTDLDSESMTLLIK